MRLISLGRRQLRFSEAGRRLRSATLSSLVALSLVIVFAAQTGGTKVASGEALRSGGPPLAGNEIGPPTVWDSVDSWMLAFAGTTDPAEFSAYLNVLWSFDPNPASWTELIHSYGPPPVRLSYSALWDGGQVGTLASGGATGLLPFLNDLWTRTFATPPVGMEKLHQFDDGCSANLVENDVINLVFTKTGGIRETMDFFDERSGWPAPDIGHDFCAELSDGTIVQQDDQRTSDVTAMLGNRHHVRFFHDPQWNRTLAAVHRDLIHYGCPIEGPPFLTLVCHTGAEYGNTDVIAGMFGLSPDDVVDGVLVIPVG